MDNEKSVLRLAKPKKGLLSLVFSRMLVSASLYCRH